MEPLVDQSLQEADFNHVAPALTCGGSLERGSSRWRARSGWAVAK